MHYIGDWGFDNPDTIARWDHCNVEDAYCDYFQLVEASAQSGMFDIIGHPDLIKKFGHKPTAPSARITAAIEAMLQAIKISDCTMEISSAGLRKPVGEIYPAAAIVQQAAARAIPFAYGSDAHAPSEVGHGMDHCMALLERSGIHEIATFQQRKRAMQPISHAA